MKVGDVVCLSEYGIARGYNLSITRIDPYQIGVITKKLNEGYNYPYKVHWMNTLPYKKTWAHSRRELKYAGR
jgi:hypothetical protein